jgi:hypothetical protein
VSPPNLIALIAVVVSPASALAGVWLSARLSRRARLDEQQDHARQEALAGLGAFAALAVDANPQLVLAGQLREYASPAEAASGLHTRWLTAREPLMIVWMSHPSPQVRELAFTVQANLEMVLRITEKAAARDAASMSPLTSAYDQLLKDMEALGRLLL